MLRQSRFSVAALVAVMGLIVACGDGKNKDNEDLIPTPDPDNLVDRKTIIEVSGDLTADTTWTADNEYLLLGRVGVPDGITLTIMPGVKIRGSKSPVGWLQVQIGGKLEAVGAATQPIVFTSSVTDNPQRGDWGGVVILGKAKNNVGAAGSAPGLAVQAELEGDGGSHGGNDDADSSGTLKYVRIEFAGLELSPDNELNALTLGSVGRGTTLEYVQAHFGLDDAFEFFGGTVNGKYLVASGPGDDCFDTDEGYRGVLQFIVCLQATGTGDNGLEASNTGAPDKNATPRANPQLANFTFVGAGEYTVGKGVGLMFKDGTAGLATNGLVINYALGGLDIDGAVTDSTFASVVSNSDGSTVEVKNTIFFGNLAQNNSSIVQFPNQQNDPDAVTEQVYAVGTTLTAAARNNSVGDPKLNSLEFSDPNLLPGTGSLALNTSKCPNPATLNSAFEAASYCGAFKDVNWMEGWTRFSVIEDPTVGAVAVSGDIAENTTWTADKKYLLVGKVAVLDGATLTIEAGTQIFGSKSPLGWLQVQRGGKINAIGTASNPIVFTSSMPEGERQRGDWGGLVILGKALNNLNDANEGLELEGDGGIHGGTNDADSSGTLKYVRIEYAGWELSPNNELNVLTMGSVGSGTTLEFVQVHMGLDDGFEWFGGAVNGKNLVATGVDDDCFDTDEGYNGKLQFLVCVMSGDVGNRGLEASNTCELCNHHDITPRRAHPKIANFTFVGSLTSAKSGNDCLNINRGSVATVINGICTHFKNSGLDLDQFSGNNATHVVDAATVDLSQVIFYGNRTSTATDIDHTQFANDNECGTCPALNEITFAQNIPSFYGVNPQLPNITLSSSLNLVPPAASPAVNGSCGANPTSKGFAINANYCGAFKDSNWMAGWISTKQN